MARFCAVPALLALVVVATAAAATKPSLHVVSRGPLAVTGDHFRPGEHVVVTAFTGFGPRRSAVVARAGRFAVKFAVPTKGCGAAYAVRATGRQGSTAMLVLGEAPPCVPPPIR